MPIVFSTQIKIMNKKAYIKNVIRTTLAEVYEKQASAEKAPVTAVTITMKPVTPLQKLMAPILLGTYGAVSGGMAAKATQQLTDPYNFRRGKNKQRMVGMTLGGGVGGAGAALLANYLQDKIRKQELDAVKAGR